MRVKIRVQDRKSLELNLGNVAEKYVDFTFVNSLLQGFWEDVEGDELVFFIHGEPFSTRYDEVLVRKFTEIINSSNSQ